MDSELRASRASTPLVELATTEPLTAAAFSLDGSAVATASLDRTVKIWSTQTGALISSLEGTTRFAFAGWFSPDGARLITISDNDSAKLWDVATGTLLVSYDGHKGDIRDVVFSPDGRVLTISRDRTVKLWDETPGVVRRGCDRCQVQPRRLAGHDRNPRRPDLDLGHPPRATLSRRDPTHRWCWKSLDLSDGVLLPHDR